MGQLRARLQEEKANRRAAILDATAALWGESGYQGFRMADLAARTGVAKGTLYIYFSTREHLFLALLEERLHGWMERIQAGLIPMRDAGGKEVARLLCREFAADPVLDQLLPLLESTIEPGVPAETVGAEFRKRLNEHAASLAASLEAALADLQKGQGAEAYALIRTLHTGHHLMRQPAELPLENALAAGLRGLARKKKKKEKGRK